MPSDRFKREDLEIHNAYTKDIGSLSDSKLAETDKASRDWFPKAPTYPLPGESTLAWNKADWTIATSRCALLVHDMQGFWVERLEDPELLVANISRLITSAREKGIPIVYSLGERVRNKAERGLSLDLWGPGICSVSDVLESDAGIIPELAPTQSDYCVLKSKYSAFYDTGLEKILRKTARDQLIVSGLFAHHGCLATALDAFMRNIQVFMVADATGDYTRAQHEMALAYVAETSGVISTTNIAVGQLG